MNSSDEPSQSLPGASSRWPLREQVAAWEHERWSSWMRWMFANWTDENIARWKRQMVTPYAELSEHEKNSDRKEAAALLALISSGKSTDAPRLPQDGSSHKNTSAAKAVSG